ncbi:putative cytochrome P450 [Thozetella sp. PMI_491]|nr:putative cytochrome P450 [Thozetella sp. PMI_491]
MDIFKSAVAVFVGVVGFIIVAILPYAFRSSRPKNFPPGPPTIPVLGNLHLIPTSKSFILFHEWAKKYGPVIGLKFAGANVVILNNYRDVQALLESRGNIYSSRPPNYIAHKILFPGDIHILMSPYGTMWRAQRRAISAMLTSRAVEARLPQLEIPITHCLANMIRDPQNYYHYIRHLTTSVMLSTNYGLHEVPFGDSRVSALYDVQERWTAIVEPGATPPVDFIPFLRYLPEWCATWKQEARKIRVDMRKLYMSLFRDTEERLRRGLSAESLVGQLIESQDKHGLDEEHMAYVGGALLEAGSDTTASQLQSFLLGCLQNPSVMKKAQTEVDRRCGVDKVPNCEDLIDLPYIEACMHEVLRWRSVVAGGVPHMLMENDTYKGFFLPAGTIVFANTWGLHHDEDEYDQPDLFNPDRWLDNIYGSKRVETNNFGSKERKTTYSFGSGRRICAGQKQAEATIKLAIAKLVWTFDVRKPKGMEDEEPLWFYLHRQGEK